MRKVFADRVWNTTRPLGGRRMLLRPLLLWGLYYWLYLLHSRLRLRILKEHSIRGQWRRCICNQVEKKHVLVELISQVSGDKYPPTCFSILLFSGYSTLFCFRILAIIPALRTRSSLMLEFENCLHLNVTCILLVVFCKCKFLDIAQSFTKWICDVNLKKCLFEGFWNRSWGFPQLFFISLHSSGCFERCVRL